jgi:hypothetical protein
MHTFGRRVELTYKTIDIIVLVLSDNDLALSMRRRIGIRTRMVFWCRGTRSLVGGTGVTRLNCNNDNNSLRDGELGWFTGSFLSLYESRPMLLWGEM